jgi:regulation of enolase protein 1 (concanavalin A-like superfamily)
MSHEHIPAIHDSDFDPVCEYFLSHDRQGPGSAGEMEWLHEPQKWEVQNDTLSMFVPPKTDYWRLTHYGHTIDNGPFRHTSLRGEFEVRVKISGDYKAPYDQSGLMLRLDHEHWIKAGIELVDGRYNLSVVVTHTTSDWSVVVLPGPVAFVWIKAVRQLDSVKVFYSFDGARYTLMREAWFRDEVPLMVGVMGASPGGEGFEARFEEFSITRPDS